MFFFMAPIVWVVETVIYLCIMIGIPSLGSLIAVKYTRFSKFWGVVFLLIWLILVGIQLFYIFFVVFGIPISN